MNWKLILSLSMIGLAMALLTISIIPSTVEPIFWLVLFFVIAFVVTSNVPKGKYFIHAFLVSVVSGLWIGIVHALFHDTYMANHPQEAQMATKMAWMESPMAMVVLGPIFGAIFGLISGCVSMLVGKFRKPKVQQA